VSICETGRVWKMIISYTIRRFIITYKGWVPVHIKKAYREYRYISQLILNLGTR